MISLLKSKKVTVLFNTNGILLTPKKQEELIDSNLDEIRISLDAASADGYQAMRGSNKFHLIVDNLHTMARRLHSRKLSKPKLSLWYLANRENIHELPNLIELAASIGVNEVHLQRLVYFLDNEGYGLARSDKSLTDPGTEVSQLMQQSLARAEELGIIFTASGLTDPVHSIEGSGPGTKPWKNCFRPWEVIYITAQGNVLPCCISPFSTTEYSSIVLGNIFESSVEEIWYGSRYQAFRRTHQSSIPPKCCQGCGTRWSL